MDKPAGYTSLRRIGDLKHSWRPDDHDGWMLLNGRTVTRANYPKFFEALAINGDTISLPVGKDAVLIGAGGRLKLMQSGGSNEVTLTVENLPPHDHAYVDTIPEAASQKSGLLAGVLTILSGLTAKVVERTTKQTGSAKPVKIEPVAIGANIFVFTGRAL